MTPPADDLDTAPAVEDGLERRHAREQANATDVTDGGPKVDDNIRSRPPEKSPMRNSLEWIAVIAGAIIIAVVVRTFLLQTFWIPSPSMSPTLVENDRVLVNKISYRLHDVHRGDVIVFERPPTESSDSRIKDLIKRVVGVPGDTVSIRDGKVYIDGRELEEPYVHGLQTLYDGACTAAGVDLDGLASEEGWTVPEGQLFVMGDNRVNSHDGRCFGPIDEDLVVGRAFYILWPPSHAGGL